jgi:MFS family permease
VSLPHGALAPLRDRRFRWFYASQAVDLWGTTMAPIALAFAVLAIDDSATALGQVLAARSIPTVLLLLVGGVVADRFGRRLVIQVSNGISALSQATAAGLVITGQAELWHLVLIAAVNGTADAANFPATQGMVPQLVPRSQLQAANALLATTRGALLAIGPSTAALLVVTVGPGWALAVDAVTWLVAMVLLVPVHIPPRVRGVATSALQDLRDGWTLFRTTTWLWQVVVAFGILNALIAGAWHTLGPPLALDTVGVSGWGYVLSAYAVGLVIGGVVMMRVRIRRPLRAGMAGCTVFAAPLLVLGLDPALVPLLACAFAAGIGMEVFGVGWSLAMQENIAEDKLSRAYSYDALGSFVAIPLGQLAIGPLGAAWGLQPVITVVAVAYAAVCLATLLSRPVRTLERHEAPVAATSP